MVRCFIVIVSDCEVKDPRIRRTRQALQGALRGLMKSKGFDEVSVQDIADAAVVNRATFYDHYTDKFALLEAMVAGGFHQLLRERSVSYDGTCASAANRTIGASVPSMSRSTAPVWGSARSGSNASTSVAAGDTTLVCRSADFAARVQLIRCAGRSRNGLRLRSSTLRRTNGT